MLKHKTTDNDTTCVQETMI